MAGFIITATYGAHSVSHYFFALARELAQRGHHVTLLVPGQRYDIERPADNPAILTWPSLRPTRWQDARFLQRLLRAQRPACIIGNFAAVNLSLLVGAWCGVPNRIAWYHTMTRAIELDHRTATWKSRLLKARKRLVYRFATQLIANSAAAARDLQRVYRVPADKCSVLPFLLPVPAPTQEPPAHDPNRIVCVGRLDESKGQATLIRALPLIRQRCPQAQVIFIGNGQARPRYEGLAAQLQVSEACHFKGTLPLGEVLREMAAAAVCVSASQSEAFGLTNIEAQSVGTPVVASAIDGIKELVLDGETGFLVPADDATAFAQKISALLTDGALRARFGARARAHFAEKFSAQNIGRHAAWFEELVERRPA
jgi:glycosyltransferase involved in cell wall biosynthesis